MFRFTSCFLLLVGWLGVASSSLAQEHPGLSLNPTRLRHARQLEAKALRENDSLLLAESWYLLGEQYEEVGNYQTAQPYFLKALRILEPRGKSYELVKLYVRLSETEQRQSHFQESLRYALAARRVAQQSRSVEGLAIAYRMLGHIREFIWNGKGTQADYNSVLFCYKESERWSTQLKDTLKIAEANAFLGAFFLRNQPQQAIPYLKKALRFFTLKNDYNWQVRTLLHLSTAYQFTDQLALSWKYLAEAEKMYVARQLNEHGIRAMIESRFLTHYERTGQWEKALDHHKKLMELENKRLLADRNGALSRLSIEYETAKKEELLQSQKREIDLRQKALNNQQRFTIAMAALLLLAIGVSIVYFRLYRKNQRISHRNEELIKEQNHRVKNNLQVISSLLQMQSRRLADPAAQKAVEESQLRIESMAILHRRLYDGDRFAEVNLDEFIPELIQGVLKAYGYQSLEPEYTLNAGFIKADKAVPFGLILNELITNACKYAFPGVTSPNLSVCCMRNGNKIKLKVADNGPGMGNKSFSNNPNPSETKLTNKKSSFGMVLIQSQATQLEATFYFTSDTRASGTVFSLDFTP